MKFFAAAAALAFAGAAVAAKPYPCYLSQEDAEDIVHAYASVLQNQTYKGHLPEDTTKIYLSTEYVEISDSILALQSKNNTLGVQGAAAVGRDQWYAGVSQHPIPKIITRDILVAGGSNVLWYWTFDGLGPPLPSQRPVTGFNLLRIDENLQIYEADIEFNSIAWGVDIFELQQWCS